MNFAVCLLAVASAALAAESEPVAVHSRLDVQPCTLDWPQDKTFSLLCWNVEWFPYGQPPEQDAGKVARRIERVADVLREAAPTLAVLSEMEGIEPLRRMGLNGVGIACTRFERAADENPDLPAQNIALLSRIPWHDVWVIDFASLAITTDRPPRGILGAEFRREGKKLTLYGLHLKSNLGLLSTARLKRQRAIRYLLEDWERRSLDPSQDAIIVMGDFNTSEFDYNFRNELTLPTLRQAGMLNLLQHQPNLSPISDSYIRHKDLPIDFDQIWVSPPLRNALASNAPLARILPTDAQLSDHRPVFAPGIPLLLGQ